MPCPPFRDPQVRRVRRWPTCVLGILTGLGAACIAPPGAAGLWIAALGALALIAVWWALDQ